MSNRISGNQLARRNCLTLIELVHFLFAGVKSARQMQIRGETNICGERNEMRRDRRKEFTQDEGEEKRRENNSIQLPHDLLP